MTRMTDAVISVIGLGYVGLPVAVAFARRGRVIGFDLKTQRIAELKAGLDRNLEVSAEELADATLELTTDPAALKAATFHIVTVPTPITPANQPDLSKLRQASETVGAALKPGDIVVFESTVYPGATEEVCVPVLERVSGLTLGQDFKVGYSPERINPGDHEHTFTRIEKVVSGSDPEALDTIAAAYESVVDAGVFRATSIKVAEAAKVIENTQRDLNIAFMNELAVLFDRLDIETGDVLEAAGTKWNFLRFHPGLVGGHCIGVDPYYLTHKAESVGYIPQVILAGRRINDGMGIHVARQTVKQLILAGHNVNGAVVTILGITFKANTPDLRNTRVIDVIRELQSYGVQVQVHDPVAEPAEAEHEYGVQLAAIGALRPCHALVGAVDHRDFYDWQHDRLTALTVDHNPVFVNVRSPWRRADVEALGMRAWYL